MRKFEEIEILRAGAILGVVAIHVLNDTLWNYKKALFGSIANYLSHAIILFVLISGFVLGLKYRSDFSVINFYKKRFTSIVPQYLIFSVIYISYEYYFLFPEAYDGYAKPFTLANFSMKLITGSATPHFWFFILIIKFYFIYPLLIRLIENRFYKNNFLILFVCMLLMNYCWIFFSTDIRSLLSTNSAFVNRLILPLPEGRSFFSYLIYFVSGIYMSSNIDIIKRELGENKYIYLFLGVMLIIALLKVCGNYFNVNIPPLYTRIRHVFISPFIYILLYIVLYRLSIVLAEGASLLKKIMVIIGKYSFGIYMVHILVMIAIGPVFLGFNEGVTYEWKYIFLYYISAILLSMFILKLISLLPYSEFVVGGNIRNKR